MVATAILQLIRHTTEGQYECGGAILQYNNYEHVDLVEHKQGLPLNLLRRS